MSLKHFFSPKFLINIALIAGGIASLISGVAPTIGIILSFIGFLGFLCSLYASNAVAQQEKYFVEAQVNLFSRAGLGNVYVEALKTEVRETGRCNKTITSVQKSLATNPADKEALTCLCPIYALRLSLKKFVGLSEKESFTNALLNTKKLTLGGLSLYPDATELLDSMGIILDLEEKHEEARTYFLKSGKLRPDPYWRLLMSTSWLMSKEPKKAIEELEDARNEGAEGWMLDLYYGNALHADGKFEEAQNYLDLAYRTRGNKPELLHRLAVNAIYQGKYLVSVKYQFLQGIATLPFETPQGWKSILAAIAFLNILFLCLLRKLLWLISFKITFLRKIIGSLTTAEEPELTLSAELLENGHADAAEKLILKNIGKRDIHECLKYKTRLLGNLGNVYFMQDKPEDAYDIFSELKKINKENNNSKDLVVICKNLASVYELRGDMQNAKKCIVEAYNICKSSGDKDMMAKMQSILDELGC